MAQATPRITRNKERIFLLANTILLGLLFFTLFNVLQRDFAEVPQRLSNGTMINLKSNDPGGNMQTLLERGYYFDDKRDVELVRSIVAKGLNTEDGTIDNIGELNKQKYNINADEAFARGGESFKKRVEASRSLLGFTGVDAPLFFSERSAPQPLPATVDAALGKHAIKGSVLNREGDPVSGVLVRLQMILPQDSLYSDAVSEVTRLQKEAGKGFNTTYVSDSLNNRQLQSLTAYARTDASGKFAFQNLPGDKAFEVLPLQPGYQFGTSQGVQGLRKNVSFNFYQSPHTIKLFSSRDFAILKKEKALIVRTPDDFNRWYWIIVASFFLGFILVHIFLSVRLPQIDGLVLPVLMLLTGLSFIALFSLQDPLRDRFLAKDTLLYFGAGLFLMFVMLFFNLRR